MFFDADNDGDTDLYVAAGGYEFQENDPALHDRLYLNDGHGNFLKKENALPQLFSSSACVKAGDIDGDGDLDLFIGGRVIPGKYPLPPSSYILINDGKGNFQNETATLCPELLNLGMVTDAQWLDVNNDKLPDLVIVGEWMPVKVFINKNGKLSDQSGDYIHFASTGWWNRIHAEDMDGDGDVDLVLGNCGLNTQFRASEKEPMTLYYKDFDGNGTIDPIICYYIQGVSYPLNSKDDLTDQLPAIKKNFLEYKAYSVATLHDLFSPEELKDTVVLKAEIMQTIYLENQGGNGFAMHHLPLEAQVSPVFGIVAEDLNGDGKKDLLLAGNNTWTRIKFGRYSANHGVLLLGDGKSGFTYMPQTKSGLNIRGNVRSLKLVHSGNAKLIIAGVNDNKSVLLHLRSQGKENKK